MERFIGKSIMIGRDPENSRLFISIGNKGTKLGSAGSVPGCVSRNIPKAGSAHCKLTYTKEYGLIITNIKTGINHTYVNSVDVEKAPVKLTDTVELGAYKYRLDLNAVIGAAKKMVEAPAPPPLAVDIRHLEGIWNNYEQTKMAIQKRGKKIGLLQSMPIAIGSVGSLASFAINPAVGGVVTVISLSVILYTFTLRKKDNSIEEQQALSKNMEVTYVCPHCKHFLGLKSYTVVTQDGKCPWCKAKYLFDVQPPCPPGHPM